MLGFLPARRAREVVARYPGLVTPGSYMVLSCGRCDDPVMWQDIRKAYTAADAYNHAPVTIRRFLAGLELVPPGVVATQNWRGRWHDVPAAAPGPAYALGAVARKPVPPEIYPAD